MTFPDTYLLLAQNHVRREEPERAVAVMQEYLRDHPEVGDGYANLADVYVMLGKLDDAEEAISHAESLAPGSLFAQMNRWDVHVLRGEWPEAESVASSLRMSSDPFRRWVGSVFLSRNALARGRVATALEEIERSSTAFPEPGRFSAVSHMLLAELLLGTGRVPEALDHARTAREHGQRDLPGWLALRIEALAEAEAGRWGEAERLTDELRRFADSMPGPVFQRELHRLRGELAKLRGDNELAVQELGRASEMIPRRLPSRPPPPSVPIWYAYATALVDSGREDEAFRVFQRIMEATGERITAPLEYVRSLYFLARIHEQRGELARARELYGRFVELWRDGELDRDRVEEASSKL